MENRLDTRQNANLVIWGAIAGDIIGSAYEFNSTKNYNFKLFTNRSRFTDDTVCTIAIAEALLNNSPFAPSLQKWGRKYYGAGYGGAFRHWLVDDSPCPYGSWGNGSAMRVSPVGAIAASLDETLSMAKATSEVSHNHTEGIKGAQAVAASIYMALHGSSKEEIKKYVEDTFEYDLSRKYEEIKPDYHFEVSCMRSVPESIICFLESDDYESAVRLAVSMGGDADTMGCIAGGIAAAYYGSIPDAILDECRLRLTDDIQDVIVKFGKIWTN